MGTRGGDDPEGYGPGCAGFPSDPEPVAQVCCAREQEGAHPFIHPFAPDSLHLRRHRRGPSARVLGSRRLEPQQRPRSPKLEGATGPVWGGCRVPGR